MAQIASAAPYITAATTVLSVYSMMQQSKAQQQQANLLAAQKEKDANQANVEAQAEAANERRKAKYTRSRALAVAGASGAGVDDPTVNEILTGIETEGEVNALNALYSGEYLASSLRSSADATRRSGAAAKNAGYVSAASTALSGSTSWADKYGEKNDEEEFII